MRKITNILFGISIVLAVVSIVFSLRGIFRNSEKEADLS